VRLALYNMYLNIAPSTLGNQSYVWKLWILFVISGHLTASRTPCHLPCTQIQNLSLTCPMTVLKPCWKLSSVCMNSRVTKQVSDVLQFVIVKSEPQVSSFISVRECVFDLYCTRMSAVVVETTISNIVVCENFPIVSVMLWTLCCTYVPHSVTLETEHILTLWIWYDMIWFNINMIWYMICYNIWYIWYMIWYIC
jgi:hypothetical protein